jgi:autotransporter-associated beta strand protein
LAVVLLSMVCLLMAPPAFADGGVGGTGNGNAGGDGGAGTTGESGGAGTPLFGGGGGGGAGGGAGGAGLSAGGTGGTAGSVNGHTGASVVGTSGVTNGSGSGGGGGWNGNDTGTAGSGQVTINNSGTLIGGNGGDGGSVINTTGIATFGSGGGGGAGGYGAIVTGINAAGSNSGTIRGGNGGSGGSTSAAVGGLGGGSGGDGGVGVLFTGSGVTFTNNGSVTGGNGGTQGVGLTSLGANGLGGAGVVGSNLTVINSGSIVGGTSGFILGISVQTQADAITFTGGANTLTLQGSTWTLTGNIGINGGGSLTFNQSTAQTLGNTLTGNGSVIQNGLGTLTLTGASTYTGGTTVTAGLINFAAGNNLGTGTITLNGGGLQWATGNTLDISSRLAALGAGGGTIDTNGNDVTFATGLTGTGGFTKAGAGTLTLAGVGNNYSGATIVLAGVLMAGGLNSFSASSAVTVASGATLDVNGFNQTIGSLAGAGTVTNADSVAAILTAGGNNSSTTFSGVIQNGVHAIGLIKTGSGTLTLSGANTYTGPTTIDAGALAVNGSLTSNTTVNVGGTLQGTGTITGSVTVAGTIAPGNSIGTLSISGAYTQGAGSTYQVEVNSAGQGDRITVTGAPGTATLSGGTVQVIAAPGTYGHTTTYTILSATGGVTGTFAGVTSNFAFLKPSLSYDADDVFLLLTRSGFSGGALTPNQHAVGTALDRGDPGATGDFETVLNVLSGLDTVQGPAALDAISGQPYADFGTVNTMMGYAFANAIGNQLSGWGGAAHVAVAEACDVACDATAPSHWGAWLSGIGGLGSVPGQGSNSGTFTYNFGGTAVGLDYRLDPRILVGASLGFTTGSQWANGFNGRGSVDAFSGSLYGSFTDDALYVNAVAGYSRASNRLTRVITIPGLPQRTAYGQTTADQFVGQLEAGYRFALGLGSRRLGSITPFARLQGSTTAQAGFSEWGADSLDLTVASQTTNSLRTTLGAELQNEFGPVDLHLRLGWLHEYADTARPMTASFAGAPGVAFTVFGATPQRDGAAIGFSGRTKVGESTELYARYDGEVGGGSDNHAFTAGLRMVW